MVVEWHQEWDPWSQTKSQFNNLRTGVLAKKELRPKTQTVTESLLRKSQKQKKWAIEEMGSGNKLQRPKKGPRSLGERERQGKHAWEEGWGKAQACSLERATLGPWVLKLFFWSFPGVSIQGLGLYWFTSREGVISQCGWFWCHSRHHLPGFAAFLGLELNHNWGLDVCDAGQNFVVLRAQCLGAILWLPVPSPSKGV